MLESTRETESGSEVFLDAGRFRRGVGRQRCEEVVATFARHADVLGSQRATDALFGERSRVDRVVEKPRPVIVPQVVVGIVRVDAETSEFGEWSHDA